MTQFALNALNQPIDDNGKVVNAQHVIIYAGSHALVFDSAEDKHTYLSGLVAWSKDAYASELNEAHNALFRKYYTERDYLNVGEIPLWLDDVDYGQEASALRSWWIDTSKQLADYLAIVTEEIAIPVEEYILSLPTPAL